MHSSRDCFGCWSDGLRERTSAGEGCIRERDPFLEPWTAWAKYMAAFGDRLGHVKGLVKAGGGHVELGDNGLQRLDSRMGRVQRSEECLRRTMSGLGDGDLRREKTGFLRQVNGETGWRLPSATSVVDGDVGQGDDGEDR